MGFESPTKFSKREGLGRILIFKRVLMGMRGVTCFKGGMQCLHKKKKLKTEVFIDKKSL